MKKVITFTAKTFDEFTKEEQKAIVEKHADFNDDINLLDFNDSYSLLLEEYGFKNPKISYSLSYSPGDGASFVCDYIDIDEFFSKIPDEELNELYGGKDKNIEVAQNCVLKIIRTDNHYYHYNTIGIDNENCYGLATDDDFLILNKVKKLILSKAIELCKQLEKELYLELENLRSFETISTCLLCNEYYFDENYKIISV